MTTQDGNVLLQEMCTAVVAELSSLSQQLVRGEIHHVVHDNFCERALQFSAYVDSAILLVTRQRFAQAFALLRSALEHWAVDTVMMLGDRFVLLYANTSEEQFTSVLQRWHNGKLRHIVDEPRLVGPRQATLRTVCRGYVSEDDGSVLHPLYFESDQYDPFFGYPEDQGDFADWLDPDQARRHATEQRQRYNRFFRWGGLVESLILNDIVQQSHELHLNVHHRFLSAFVHSQRTAHEQLTPGASFPGADIVHVVQELALLYASQLIGRYAQTFLARSRRPPEMTLSNEARLRDLSGRALEHSEHLWFLDDRPHDYDLGQELLARVVEARRSGRDSMVPDAASLDATEVRYYRNPLDRLLGMHRTSRELATGFIYVSPWD